VPDGPGAAAHRGVAAAAAAALYPDAAAQLRRREARGKRARRTRRAVPEGAGAALFAPPRAGGTETGAPAGPDRARAARRQYAKPSLSERARHGELMTTNCWRGLGQLAH